MKQKGIIIILVIVLIVGIGVFSILVVNNKPKTINQKNDSNPPNVLTQDNELVNTKYYFSITYSDIFEISTPSPESVSTVNFRKKSDTIPARSGISIKVIESSASLKDVCGTTFIENEGISCDKNSFKFTPVTGSLPWEVYEEGAIGIAPDGYVYASLFADNKIYFIFNHGYESSEAYVFMINLRLSK